MRIFAVRHGQTDYNHLRLVQGYMDNPLNEEGIAQAERMGLYMQKHNYTFDAVYTSPLIRAKKTAEVIIKTLNIQTEIITEPLFIERDFGYFEGKSVDKTISMISQFGFTHDNYENNVDFLVRIKAGLNKTFQSNPNQQILLTAHSHSIKALLVLSDPKQFSFMTVLGNASLCIIDYDGNHLSVVAHNIETE